MTYTKEEVLGLPELDEDGQYEWLFENGIIKPRIPKCPYEPKCSESLADLAFRLRDEVGGISFEIIQIMVELGDDEKYAPASWVFNNAKPIHWIMAALLAKLESP